MSEKPQEPLQGDNEKDVTFLSLFNPKEARSDSTVREERLAVCRQCEFFNHRLQACGKCGCFMLAKTSLERAHCPIMKWWYGLFEIIRDDKYREIYVIDHRRDMQTKEVNDFRNTKPHQNEFVFKEVVESLKTVSAIANYLNISTKLVNIKLKEYGIRVDS